MHQKTKKKRKKKTIVVGSFHSCVFLLEHSEQLDVDGVV